VFDGVDDSIVEPSNVLTLFDVHRVTENYDNVMAVLVGRRDEFGGLGVLGTLEPARFVMYIGMTVFMERSARYAAPPLNSWSSPSGVRPPSDRSGDSNPPAPDRRRSVRYGDSLCDGQSGWR